MPLGQFSLAAHRALSARKPSPVTPAVDFRPERPVAWFHATSDTRAAALRDLAGRLISQRPEIPVLLTFDRRYLTGPREANFDEMPIVLPLDSDHPSGAAEFAAHWRPAVGLWAGGRLMPNLLSTVKSSRAPLILADWVESDLGRETRQWMPDPQRAALRVFDRVFATNAAASARLQRQGVPSDRIEVAPRLRDSIAPPPCSQDDLAETGEALASRPVWLAAGHCMSETAQVLNAHRLAVRMAHRLLLVIAPAGPRDSVDLRPQLDASGLRWTAWTPGEPIDEFTQILVVDDPDGLPLWFRLAPICLMGGTLSPDEHSGLHPFVPAALGAAVLNGPHTSGHGSAYARLAERGGARLVNGARHLSDAILHLIQPEQAARMALAGWDVVTQGAWLTDHLLEIVQDMYDTNDDVHART